MKKLSALLLLTLASPCLYAVDDANWQAVLAEDPLSGQSGCLLLSRQHQIHDGQGRTPVQLIFNGTALVAQTRSNVDLSYANLGLQVDNYEALPIDRLLGETSVAFETQADKIREQFIRGRTARLALGFWPTWPKTKAVVTEFTLFGFTRAYRMFLQCQKTGELP